MCTFLLKILHTTRHNDDANIFYSFFNLWWKTSAESTFALRLVRRFISQAEAHRATISKEWLRDTSVNVLEWPRQSPDSNPIQHLRGYRYHGCTPNCLQIVVPILWHRTNKALKLELPIKGTTNQWAKAVNVYVRVIFFFF